LAWVFTISFIVNSLFVFFLSFKFSRDLFFLIRSFHSWLDWDLNWQLDLIICMGFSQFQKIFWLWVDTWFYKKNSFDFLFSKYLKMKGLELKWKKETSLFFQEKKPWAQNNGRRVRKVKKERKNYVGATSNRTSFSNTCCHNMTTSVRRSHKYQERSFSEHEGSWMCHPNTTTFFI